MRGFRRPVLTAVLRPAAALVLLLAGCSSLHESAEVDAIPARRAPLELLAPPRSGMVELSISRLRQTPPDAYRLGPGDVLGVYIENVLGDSEQPLPVQTTADKHDTPAVGYPITVRDDGTIVLPLADPIAVAGLSIAEATDAIRHAYTVERRILPEGKDRIFMSLIRRRECEVVVVREESGGRKGVIKRGTGHVVRLPAYENDVLHAVSETGGLPGADAASEILVLKGGFHDALTRDMLLSQVGPQCDPCEPGLLFPSDASAIRIPLRYHPNHVPMFGEQDIVLQTGDVVMIASRDHERFYTGGALGGGEYLLPRDRDLDILQAIAVAGGVDPDRTRPHDCCEHEEALVVRKIPCAGQVTLRVDLRRALSDPRERILIQAEDLIVVP